MTHFQQRRPLQSLNARRRVLVITDPEWRRLLTAVPITNGKGRKASGVMKRISSFFTERRNLRNVILEGSGANAGKARTMARAFEARRRRKRRRSGGGGRRERRGADGEGERVSGPRITMKTEGGLERHRHSQTEREGGSESDDYSQNQGNTEGGRGGEKKSAYLQSNPK